MKTTAYRQYAAEELQRHRGLLFMMGFLLLILGFVATRVAFLTTVTAFMFLGSVLAVGGLLEMIDAVRTRKSGSFFMKFVGSLLTLAIGISFMFRPMLGAVTLTLLIGIFLVAVGSLRATAAVMTRFEQWGWYFLSGVVGFLFGIYILLQWPTSSLWVVGLFLGVDLMLFGWSTIMLAFAARRSPDRSAAIPT